MSCSSILIQLKGKLNIKSVGCKYFFFFCPCCKA